MHRLMSVILVLVVAACGGDDAATTTAAGSASTTQAPTATTAPAPASTTSPSTTVTTGAAVTDAAECAHVVDATIDAGADGFTISATVRSGDTGWDKYADLWEVRDQAGTLLGERVLAHPHETEQPFTRSVSGVEIPNDVVEVVIVARDSVSGFCGDAFTVAVPQS